LPETLADASEKAAHQLGISRTAFIRQAIIHELTNLQIQLETKAIVDSFSAMKTDKDYIEESTLIESALNTKLPRETTQWWKKSQKKKRKKKS
jgi:hypothetical protein